MMICGIDPGLSGGIAFIDTDEYSLNANRAPVLKIKKGTQNKRYIDAWKIMTLFTEFDPEHVYIEKQQAMPKQGVSSTFVTGFGYGVYLGMFIALGIPYTEVNVREWKRDFGLSSDKDESRKRASELMPRGKQFWQQKNEDGVAEAALIAYWGATKVKS